MLTELDIQCIQKARECNPNLDSSWLPYLFEAVDNGMIIKGCNTSKKRDGSIKYNKKDGALILVIERN